MKKQNIEVEGWEIVIQSKEGHYAVIPAKHRQEVMDMVKGGCDDCINNYIQTLPKDSDYAKDGSLYPEEPSINPNSPIELDAITITAKAPTYVKYKQEWEKENPFDLNKYVDDRFNNPIGREAISRINEKDWKKQLEQEGLKKRQAELDKATKMGLLYQRFNPQGKDDISIADDQFRRRYNTSPHRYRYDNDSEYRKYYEQINKNATSKIDYSSTDLRRKDVVAPNNMWMYPNLIGENKKAMTDFSNEIIGAALPIPGLETMGKIPSVFKAGKNLIKPIGKATNQIDDVIKNLPKLEQMPLNFNMENVLKNTSKVDKKNMLIIKEGDKYFKELNNSESLKKLKEFGDEYGINLLDNYIEAEKRWDYGKNIGKHERFQIKETPETWIGLSTNKMSDDETLKAYSIKNKYGEGSLEYSKFLDGINDKNRINYLNSNAAIEDYSTAIWHELSHDINSRIIGKSSKLQKEISELFTDNVTDVSEEYITKARKHSQYKSYENGYIKSDSKNLTNKNFAKNEFDYITKPTETWAFLSTNLRQDLKNTGIIKNYNELLTSEKLEQAVKNGNTIFSRFEPYIKDKNKFINLFNKMTLSVAPIAGYKISQQSKNK